MHHSISYHMAKARIADLRHHTPQETLARATRRSGRRRRPSSRPLVPRRTWAASRTAQAAQPAAAGEAPTR
jgi:hypothetical protein